MTPINLATARRAARALANTGGGKGIATNDATYGPGDATLAEAADAVLLARTLTDAGDIAGAVEATLRAERLAAQAVVDSAIVLLAPPIRNADDDADEEEEEADRLAAIDRRECDQYETHDVTRHGPMPTTSPSAVPASTSPQMRLL